MCDDAAALFLPSAFRRICTPLIEPIDPPTTNVQDYVRRVRVIAARPTQRPEGTPVALAVLRVDTDSVTVAALARGSPRYIAIAFAVVPSGEEEEVINGATNGAANGAAATLTLLPTAIPGLLWGTLPPESLRPSTLYQFTVSAFFQYGSETPRIYTPRDASGYPVTHRLWTHGAPVVTGVVGRMVLFRPPAVNLRRPAWYERYEPGGQQDRSSSSSSSSSSITALGRGPQSEALQVFMVFASTAPDTQTATVGPLTSGAAFAPASLPAGVEYNASYALAVYAFNGDEAEEQQHASPLFSVAF